MTSITASYRTLTRDIGRTMSNISSLPEVRREVDYFMNNIGNIKTADEFLKNQRLYTFAMKAFGMSDLVYAKGMMKKVLNEGLDSPDAFALNLSDQRFREFAQVFNFKSLGSATTSFDRAQQGTVDRFLRNTLEERAGQTDDALRLALYFDRKAPGLISEYSILADRAVFEVVRTSLGLPDAIAGTDIEKQARLLATRINIEDFADPAKRAAFITRFLAMRQAKSDSSASDPAVATLTNSSPRIDMNTLMSLQGLKRFGS